MSFLFEAECISTGYKKRPLLVEGLTMSLSQGNLVAVIGPNGAGKSTLLRIFCGLQAPLKGTIRVGGQKIYKMTPSERAKWVGALFSEAPRYSGLMVEELVALGRYPYSGMLGKLSIADEAEIDNALALVDCSHLKGRNTDALSDGELQKVMLARLLAQQTPIIVLDEPTTFLDLPARIRLFRLLRSVAENLNKIVVFSSHDIEMALHLAHKILLLTGSSGYVVGTPDEIVAHEAFRTFLPEEDVEMLNGKLNIKL